MRPISRLLATVGAVMGVTALTGTPGAIAADSPPPAVEDYAYPHADKIYQERGIQLKRGDGHIVLVACDNRAGLIEVYARGMQDVDKVGQGKFCFHVSGNSGYLSLELPRVYGAKGNDYDTSVNMRTGTGSSAEDKSFKLEKNLWTPVGESADNPQRREFSLREIVATK
ncbi:hypothetical protein [Streptomyces blastmyceticus]|uniref:Secreted protein n=1 Tax=Streptomyces blastmyceticus TaxID=68180 RepID=A0ABP3GHJ9_9ACTN